MKKEILITGASRGLGYCFVRRYLEEGNRVFAGYRNCNGEGLMALKQEYGDLLELVVLEVTDTASVQAAAARIEQLTDHLDIIINSAGIHCDTSFDILEETNLDDCNAVYDVNAVGPLRVVKAFLTQIKKGTEPKIINISSESGSITWTGRVKEFDYCMSKTALNMSSKLLSNYLKEDNIIVLAVQPGWMRTDMGGPNADLDPYENAGKLVALFDRIKELNHPVFIDNEGKAIPW